MMSHGLQSTLKPSIDTLKYAEHMEMKVTACRYPSDGDLEKLIEEKKLFPLPYLVRSLSFNLGFFTFLWILFLILL